MDVETNGVDNTLTHDVTKMGHSPEDHHRLHSRLKGERE